MVTAPGSGGVRSLLEQAQCAVMIVVMRGSGDGGGGGGDFYFSFRYLSTFGIPSSFVILTKSS